MINSIQDLIWASNFYTQKAEDKNHELSAFEGVVARNGEAKKVKDLEGEVGFYQLMVELLEEQIDEEVMAYMDGKDAIVYVSPDEAKQAEGSAYDIPDIDKMINPDDLFNTEEDVEEFIRETTSIPDLAAFKDRCEQEELYHYCEIIQAKINSLGGSDPI